MNPLKTNQAPKRAKPEPCVAKSLKLRLRSIIKLPSKNQLYIAT